MKPAFGGEGASIAAIYGGDVYLKPGVYDRLKEDQTALSAAIEAASWRCRAWRGCSPATNLDAGSAPLDRSAGPRRGAQLLSRTQRRHDWCS